MHLERDCWSSEIGKGQVNRDTGKQDGQDTSQSELRGRGSQQYVVKGKSEGGYPDTVVATPLVRSRREHNVFFIWNNSEIKPCCCFLKLTNSMPY
jgi:hypothetical protein